MIICNNKAEFLNELGKELTKFGVSDQSEIIADFEQHFSAGTAEGLTEAQVCEKLGDISEIAKQYVDEEIIERAETAEQPKETYTQNQQNAFEGNGYQNTQTPPPVNTQYNQNTGFRADGGKVAGVICVDVFVFTWALPALIGVVIGYLAIPLSLACAGLATFVGGIASIFTNIVGWSSPFVPISTILFSVMIMALAGLAVMLGIVIVKGTIGVFKNIINWHGRVFNGKNVFTEKKPVSDFEMPKESVFRQEANK